MRQMFQQPFPDLQWGNFGAAGQDGANIQQAFQSQPGPAQLHHHHHHSGNQSGSGTMSPTFARLGQALESGNRRDAQRACRTPLEELLSSGQWGGQGGGVKKRRLGPGLSPGASKSSLP